jgi:hypothetical protein
MMSHSISEASARKPRILKYVDNWLASGERTINQPTPASAISTPRIRGRKVDLKMR